MPSAIEFSGLGQLQSAMEKRVQTLFPAEHVFGAPEKMRRTAEIMRKRLQDVSGDVDISRVCLAVATLNRDSVKVLSRSDMRLVCQGLHHACPNCGNRMPIRLPIDEFSQLMKRITEAAIAKEIKAFAWYGLLYSYFSAQEKDAVWKVLKETLELTFTTIHKNTSYRLPWLDALAEHHTILGDEPCKALAQKILAGENISSSLKKTLSIPEESWFWKELILAQIRHAILLKDERFIDHINTLVANCGPISPGLKDEAITLLLTRYLPCRDRGAHAELKNFTLTQWGTPNLGRHKKYDLMTADVKRMVQEWVARDDLKDFFTLLQDDGVADERRLAFWSRYIKQIEYHRILVGSRIRASQERDFIELRRKPSVGRLMGGSSNNNAVAMKIGDWVFIVSSEKGNALYGYKFSRLPFRMDAADVETANYRVPANADLHFIQRGDWEDELAKELSNYKIEPDEASVKPRKNSYFTSGSRASQPATATPKTFDIGAFNKMVREHKLSVNDNRSKGGALWVQGVPRFLEETLKVWGFQYKDGRGWWRSG